MTNAYDLLSSLPENATEMPMPKYKIKCAELFKWNDWQGLGWVRIFYIAGMVVIGLMFLLMFIAGLATGSAAGILSALIFVPIFCFLLLAIHRLFAEVILAILIMPHQLHYLAHTMKQLKVIGQHQTEMMPLNPTNPATHPPPLVDYSYNPNQNVSLNSANQQ